MFIDNAKIIIKAGDGGNGAVSFHSEKAMVSGGPDGGDGGKGGNIVFVVDDNLSTLIDFRFKKKFVADNGNNGSARQCSGRAGKDLVIKVPRGTLVRDVNTGRLIADLSHNEPQVLLRGGRGGAGNQHFATPTRQIPRFAKPGKKGEQYEVMLELKLLADVGLVGFPNVGKSTLISVVSAAKPTIANYHFTTLTPVLGVVKIDEGTSFVMADIPGLIEGASDGIGLGHDFLRHIERCRLIVHVVDVSGIEGRNPIEDFEVINRELANFSEELASRPQIVALNKCDMASDENIDTMLKYLQDKEFNGLKISAATTKGTKNLISVIYDNIKLLPPIKEYEAQTLTQEEKMQIEEKSKKFEIILEDGIYFVEADFLLTVIQNVDMDDYESLQYFQRVLKSSGIISKLEEMGINDGDTVDIFGFSFDFIK